MSKKKAEKAEVANKGVGTPAAVSGGLLKEWELAFIYLT